MIVDECINNDGNIENESVDIRIDYKNIGLNKIESIHTEKSVVDDSMFSKFLILFMAI